MNKYEYWSTHLLGVEMHIIYGYALLLLNRPFLYLCSNVIPYPIWIFTHILLPTWSHQLFELVVTGRQQHQVSDPASCLGKWTMNWRVIFFIWFLCKFRALVVHNCMSFIILPLPEEISSLSQQNLYNVLYID